MQRAYGLHVHPFADLLPDLAHVVSLSFLMVKKAKDENFNFFIFLFFLYCAQFKNYMVYMYVNITVYIHLPKGCSPIEMFLFWCELHVCLVSYGHKMVSQHTTRSHLTLL